MRIDRNYVQGHVHMHARRHDCFDVPMRPALRLLVGIPIDLMITMSRMYISPAVDGWERMGREEGKKRSSLGNLHFLDRSSHQNVLKAMQMV
jgi:hypothetical protein